MTENSENFSLDGDWESVLVYGNELRDINDCDESFWENFNLEEECDWKSALAYIKDNGLKGQRAADVFAFYFEYAFDLTDEVMAEFIAAGVDIDMRSEMYHCDARNGNALHKCCEYRRLDQLEIVLKAGANVNIKNYHHVDSVHMSVINTYIGGHNPWYMCIETRENAENWLKGFDLLIEYGAEFTGEDFMWIKEEYDNTEGKQIIIENIKNLLD